MKGNLKHVFQAMFMVLATVMLLSIPASAASSKTVATIGKKSYTSLEAAVKKVKKGQTIKLKKDVKLSSPLVLNRNVKYTINLNGHKISSKLSSVTSSINIKKGTVTFKNGTLRCSMNIGKNTSVTMSSIKMPSKYKPHVQIEKKGKLTIKSGTYYSINNYGTTTIKKGTFNDSLRNISGTMTITTAKVNVSGDNTIYNNSGKMTIKGGTYTTNGYNHWVIFNGEGATLKITGGTYKNTNKKDCPEIIYNESSSLTITGGTFIRSNFSSGSSKPVITSIGTGNYLNIGGGTIENKHNKTECHGVRCSYGKCIISGGTIKACGEKCAALYTYSNTSITGGTFYSTKYYPISVSTKYSFSCKNASYSSGKSIYSSIEKN